MALPVPKIDVIDENIITRKWMSDDESSCNSTSNSHTLHVVDANDSSLVLEHDELKEMLANINKRWRNEASQTYAVVAAKTLFAEYVSQISAVDQVWNTFDRGTLYTYVLVAEDDSVVRDDVFKVECCVMDAFPELDFDFSVLPTQPCIQSIRCINNIARVYIKPN